MVGPWGALPVGLAASTTEVKKKSMAGPLGAATGRSDSFHH
jgi:hypothetical protein